MTQIPVNELFRTAQSLIRGLELALAAVGEITPRVIRSNLNDLKSRGDLGVLDDDEIIDAARALAADRWERMESEFAGIETMRKALREFRSAIDSGKQT